MTQWDVFFRYENRGSEAMNVTVEMTHGVTVSEEIEHTHEHKVSVESSVRKSFVAVAQKELEKQVIYHAQTLPQTLDGLVAESQRKRRVPAGALLDFLSTEEVSGLLSRTEEKFKEFQHTQKHS